MKAFFGLSLLEDSSRHHEYNAWHQLDHRPENLALPGVYHGERWVRTPERTGMVPTPAGPLSGTEYLNMYIFRQPVAASIAEWQDLALRSIYWGRRPDLAYTSRPFIGFFTLLRTHVSSRVLVGADVLPFRPSTGVILTIRRLEDPSSPAAQKALAHQDRERLPALMNCPGIAGAWTFLGDPSISPPVGERIPSGVLLELVYLDGDPAEAVPLAQQRCFELPAEAPAAGELLFTGVFETITPWRWDWFDADRRALFT